MGEYEYKYNYLDWYSPIQIRVQILSYSKYIYLYIYIFMDIKAIKVFKLMHICALICNSWQFVYNKEEKYINIYIFFLLLSSLWYFLTNTNTDIFGSKKREIQIRIYLVTKKGEYEYKYIWVEEKKGEYEYSDLYLHWYAQ